MFDLVRFLIHDRLEKGKTKTQPTMIAVIDIDSKAQPYAEFGFHYRSMSKLPISLNSNRIANL
jgi:hypothetical protein